MKDTEQMNEMPEGVDKQTGSCMYCGQTMILNTVGPASREQLDKWATEKCSCEKAKKVHERVRIKRAAEDNIRNMFKEKYPETEAILQASLPYVESDAILKVSIDTGTGVKGTLSKTAKGTIKVEMATSSKRAIES